MLHLPLTRTRIVIGFFIEAHFDDQNRGYDLENKKYPFKTKP
jgi:hypothetical protein